MGSVHKTFYHDLPCPIYWRKYTNHLDVLLKCVGVSRYPWNWFLLAHQSANFFQCLKWPTHDQWVPSSWLLCWHSRIMDILRASGRTTSLRKIQQLVAKATMDGAWWRYTTHKRVGIYRRYAGFRPTIQGCRFVPCTFFRKQIHRWYLSIQIYIGFQGLALIQSQIYNYRENMFNRIKSFRLKRVLLVWSGLSHFVLLRVDAFLLNRWMWMRRILWISRPVFLRERRFPTNLFLPKVFDEVLVQNQNKRFWLQNIIDRSPICILQQLCFGVLLGLYL